MQIIDILKPLLSHKASKDNLQVASTSIDISAKVYGIRVDDIHSDGLKLASNMARASEKQTPQDAGNTDSFILLRRHLTVTIKVILQVLSFLPNF